MPFIFAPRTARHPLWIAAAASVLMASLGNIPLWRALFALPQWSISAGSLFFALCFAIMQACLIFAMLTFFAWRRTIHTAATLLLLTTAACSYFMWQYQVVINSDMMDNVLQTDIRESRDLLNLHLLGVLLLLGVLPGVWLWRIPVRPAPTLRRGLLHNLLGLGGALLVCVALLLVNFQTMAGLMRTHKKLRYMMTPLNAVYALANVGVIRPLMTPRPFVTIGQDAHTGTTHAHGNNKPPLLVLVVGETARAGNFSLNGYSRNTNPLLAGDGVLSYTNVWACGTSTATSLPCMFSPEGKAAYESRANDTSTLMDVLHQAGLAVLWIDNQSGCKGVCDRVPTVSTSSAQTVPANDAATAAICTAAGECLDEIMLHQLQQRMADLPAERRQRGVVIVLHQMGSHGPAYWLRSNTATKPFQPECTTNVLQNCARDTLMNAYDNSIVYTDTFLHQTIQWLRMQKDYATAFLYVSDHGESLGENNLFLHGMPYAIAPDVQKHVPWLMWFSPTWQQQASHVDMDCLRTQRTQRYSHDHLFHTVLSVVDVHTSIYQPALDMLATCRTTARTTVDGTAQSTP